MVALVLRVVLVKCLKAIGYNLKVGNLDFRYSISYDIRFSDVKCKLKVTARFY